MVDNLGERFESPDEIKKEQCGGEEGMKAGNNEALKKEFKKLIEEEEIDKLIKNIKGAANENKNISIIASIVPSLDLIPLEVVFDIFIIHEILKRKFKDKSKVKITFFLLDYVDIVLPRLDKDIRKAMPSYDMKSNVYLFILYIKDLARKFGFAEDLEFKLVSHEIEKLRETYNFETIMGKICDSNLIKILTGEEMEKEEKEKFKSILSVLLNPHSLESFIAYLFTVGSHNTNKSKESPIYVARGFLKKTLIESFKVLIEENISKISIPFHYSLQEIVEVEYGIYSPFFNYIHRDENTKNEKFENSNFDFLKSKLEEILRKKELNEEEKEKMKKDFKERRSEGLKNFIIERLLCVFMKGKVITEEESEGYNEQLNEDKNPFTVFYELMNKWSEELEIVKKLREQT